MINEEEKQQIIEKLEQELREAEREEALLEKQRIEKEEQKRIREAEEEKIRQKTIAILKEKLGFEPNSMQIVGYNFLMRIGESDKAEKFIIKWKKENVS